MRNYMKEEVYIADFLLGQYSKYREMLPLPIFFSWIGILQGWAKSGVTCKSIFSWKLANDGRRILVVSVDLTRKNADTTCSIREV
jgi:hypothetical protein